MLTRERQSTAMAAPPSMFLTLTVAGELCGLPVLAVRDVIEPRAITQIPLAPPEVAGSLNLRGRIVTAIDLRRRLRFPPAAAAAAHMAIVVEHESELYALLVDEVAEVISPDPALFEPVPPTLPRFWSACSAGLYRLEGRLMMVLNIARLLDLSEKE